MICSLCDKIVQFLCLDVLAVFGVLQNIFFNVNLITFSLPTVKT